MAINPALLIAAPILQDYFSDNATDAAMSAGVITCYQDNSRTTLKNWYYQTGSPGAYTYTQLPNPLTLSAAGTITDANGNDTIPFWYPYSESDNSTPQPYYVTVDNSNGQRQFTRQNFPFNPNANNPNANNVTLRNLIVNNVFWRNAGTVTLTNTQYSILAPSQHDGFLNTMADITFVKNANGATDVATFTQFTNINRLGTEPTPEFYLNMSCNNSGSSETIKYIQIPICLHVDNLSGYSTATATIWTQDVSGAANNNLTLNLYQFLGTGATSPTASTLITIMPSSTWQKTVVSFSFPIATLPPGGAGDDAWFLQIGLPVGVSYNMNIAKPSVYLSNIVPVDDFDTYEFVSSTIDAPRTGDIRTSINQFQPYGWVAMNDGTIGNGSSNATARANIDTWPLFNLLWSLFNGFNNSTTNTICQMYNSAGSTIGYGATAVADFNANNAIALTKMMGRVIEGTVPSSLMLTIFNDPATGSNSAGNILITTTDTTNFYNGMPIIFTAGSGTLPDSIDAKHVYYIANNNSGAKTFNLSTTFANAMAGTVIAYGATSGTTFNAIGIPQGTYGGEYAHSQLLAELAAHTHTIAVGTGASTNTVGNNGNANSGTANTGSTGSGAAFNIVQPTVSMNMYIKL